MKSVLLFTIVILGLTGGAHDALSADLPIIPGAAGYGIETPAGSGRNNNPPSTTVYKVTNLNASGPGSLKAAIDAPGARVVIFEVSGMIELTDDLRITNPFITIAGQTAPPQGITIRGAAMRIETHDILIQHLRIRVGDGLVGPPPENRDGLGIEKTNGDVYNIVVDHCSISWGIDENVVLWWQDVHDVTVRNCIISEGLYDSVHPDGPHSMGLIVGQGIENISFIGNLFAHNHERNPLLQSDETILVNNVIYNRGSRGVDLQEGSVAMDINIVGNVFIRGLDTDIGVKPIYITDSFPANSKVYLNDNICDPVFGGTCYEYHCGFDPIADLPVATWPSGLPIRSSSRVQDWVLTYAGARPTNRDSVDVRVVKDVRNGTGTLIDSQDDVGGWPYLAQNTRDLIVPANPNDDDDGDGYTNLEEWLYAHANIIEFGGGGGSGIGGGVGGCFIATAVYGSHMAKEVKVFKKVRDEYLLTNELGRAFISAYYEYSPPLADWVAKHPTIRKFVRIGLYPVLEVSKWFVEENPSEERTHKTK